VKPEAPIAYVQNIDKKVIYEIYYFELIKMKIINVKLSPFVEAIHCSFLVMPLTAAELYLRRSA